MPNKPIQQNQVETRKLEDIAREVVEKAKTALQTRAIDLLTRRALGMPHA